MARPPRIDFPDAVYHVTSRGNGRADIFWSDGDRRRFLTQLAHHAHLTGVVLYAYVLMDNHFHLLVRTPWANLSSFMQRLLTAYALYAGSGASFPTETHQAHVVGGRVVAEKPPYVIDDNRADLQRIAGSPLDQPAKAG
jgi:REP element-mobilizing transposase RayT